MKYIQILLSMSLLATAPIALNAMEVPEPPETQEAATTPASVKAGTDWGKIFNRTKAGIEAAIAIPRVMTEAGELVILSAQLSDSIKTKLAALKAYSAQIQTVKDDKERLAMTLNTLYNVLLPLLVELNTWTGKAARPIQTVGGKFVKPYNESVGNDIQQKAALVRGISDDLKSALDEFKKAVKTQLDAATQALSAKAPGA